jgi:predicted dehydrogenase
MMEQDKLRVGVIGVGHLGKYHVEKYMAISTVELVGVVDTDAARLGEITRRYRVKGYKNHQEILDKVDAVTLSVPTDTHFDVARDFLLHGVHMLIEKPITYRLDEADDLLNLAAKNGLVLQVGLVERFNPAVVEMEALVKRPIFMESHRMNLFTVRGTDVDVVLDLMIHDLDIVLHIMQSEVKDVHAVGMSVITDKTDIASARIVFENGAAANLTASRVSGKMLRKIRAFQPDSYISADCGKRRITIISLDNRLKNSDGFPKVTTRKKEFSDSDPLGDEVEAFVKAVINGSDPVVSGMDGRKALEVALSIIHQIEKGSKNF